jgi:hypothetical protein
MRRSLTIAPENDKRILLSKGLFLTGDSPFDIDYTTMVNIFVELGLKVFSLSWNNGNAPVIVDRNEIFEIFKKHAFSPELKEESVGDQYAEIFYTRLVEQQSKKTESEPAKQTQTPSLPAQKSSMVIAKVPEYVS